MEQENDFIEREVKKIILFLRNLFAKISGVTINEEKTFVNTLDIELKEKLAVGFYELLNLEKKELEIKIKDIDVLILDELIKVFHEIYKNEKIVIDRTRLKNVLLIIIHTVDDRSRTFSFERQEIKNILK